MALTGTGSSSNYVTGSLGGWRFTNQIADWPQNGAVTIFGWARLRATGTAERLFNITNGPTGAVRVSVQTSTAGAAQSVIATTITTSTAAGATMVTGEWTPLMATLYESGGTMFTELFQGSSTYTASRASAAANWTSVGIGAIRTTSVTSSSTNVDVAEVAVWYGRLGAAEFAELASGASPLSVAAPRLQRYYPLRGDLQDWGPVHEGATQTGAYDIAWTDHPPVALPSSPPLLIPLGGTNFAADVSPQAYTYQSGAVDVARGRLADVAAQTYTYAAGAVDIGRTIIADVAALAYSYTARAVDVTYQPAATGDTHDGFLRRSRRERAIEAARRRAEEERLTERNALRLSLEAAMGMAAEVVEEAPDEAAEAVRAAVEEAAAFVPTLGHVAPVLPLEATARALDKLQAAIDAAIRAKALADDDADVEILLRAL